MWGKKLAYLPLSTFDDVILAAPKGLCLPRIVMEGNDAGDKTKEDPRPHCNKPIPPILSHPQSLPFSRPVTHLPSPGRLGGSGPLRPGVPIYDRAEHNIFLKMQMADPLLRAPGVSRRRRRVPLGTELEKGKERGKESGAGSEIVEDQDTIKGLDTAVGSTAGAQRKEKDDTKEDSASHDTDHLMEE